MLFKTKLFFIFIFTFTYAASAYAAPPPRDLLVDNRSDNAIALSGLWRPSTYTPGFYDQDYIFSSNIGASIEYYFPELDPERHPDLDIYYYKVFVSFSDHWMRAPNLTITVFYTNQNPTTLERSVRWTKYPIDQTKPVANEKERGWVSNLTAPNPFKIRFTFEDQNPITGEPTVLDDYRIYITSDAVRLCRGLSPDARPTIDDCTDPTHEK